MPQAIEWSLATPKMSAVFPSSNPIRHLAASSSSSAAYHRADARRRPRPPTARGPGRRPRAPARPRWRHRRRPAAHPRRRRRHRPPRAARAPVPDRDEHLGRQPRDACRAGAARLGVDIPPERFLSALSASAAYTRPALPGRAALRPGLGRREAGFAGQQLLIHDEAGAPGARAAAVVVGDSPEEADLRQPQPRVPPDPRRRDPRSGCIATRGG